VRAGNKRQAFTVFFHPDFTVGFGISPNLRPAKGYALADLQPNIWPTTAGGDFHPALKQRVDYISQKAVCQITKQEQQISSDINSRYDRPNDKIDNNKTKLC
jgi:hypothetical protein